MKSEDLKKQFLSSREYFTAKRWEGKPLSFKVKYIWANYPTILASAIGVFVIIPLIGTYKYLTYPGSVYEALTKFKRSYVVVRDDHPDIEIILKEKELGKDILPENLY